MAEGSELTDAFRRAMEANARLYQGWVNLSVEYLRSLTEIFDGQTAAPPGAPAEATAESLSGVLVLEHEAGQAAEGAFLVTNDLGRTLSCAFRASSFQPGEGKAVRAKVSFEPAKVDLEPGEQRVVTAQVLVPESLEPGVAYTGTVGIEGMDKFSVPVVLRRLHEVTESPIEQAQPAPSRTRGPTTKAAPSRASAKKATRKKATKKKAAKQKATKRGPR
ncbi:MAG: hypothetical protein R3E10_10095 [Gemmatimonadota bacterium]